MKRGDIVMVPFPFSDLSMIKIRPAVVLFHKIFSAQDFVCCAISSKFRSCDVKIANKDLKTGELPKKSYVRPFKLVTLSENSVRKVVGHLSKQKIHQIITQIKDKL